MAASTSADGKLSSGGRPSSIVKQSADLDEEKGARNSTKTSASRGQAQGVPLQWIIMGLLLLNVLVIAVPSITLGALTNSQSISSATQAGRKDEPLTNLAVLNNALFLSLFATTTFMYTSFTCGKASENIADLASVVQSDASALIIGHLYNVYATVVAFHTPSPSLYGLQPLKTDSGIRGTIMVWATGNFTCVRYCPVNNTQGKMAGYTLNPVTGTPMLPPVLSVPFNLTLFATERVFQAIELPSIDAPYVSADGSKTLSQPVRLSLWDPAAPASAGNPPAGYVVQVISVENLSNELDALKAQSGSPNSFYYLITSQGLVVAMSGLGNSTQQKQTLVIQDALLGPRLKTIFEFTEQEFPVLNYTTSTVLKHANRDLTSNFTSAEWRQNGYMFQVAHVTLLQFKYIVISGAIEEDYLGKTVLLSQRLTETGKRNMIILIASTMKKAVKFDFSAVRSGGLALNQSLVREVGVTQANFLELLKTFADALKRDWATHRGMVYREESSSWEVAEKGGENVMRPQPPRQAEKNASTDVGVIENVEKVVSETDAIA
ncbi:hypothetical protein HDU93_000225 [Gonapodya sp. JEL0774]|nr:hypothetical protein HDU93_000225 [Gonapodya sp. JEL0774]